MSDDPPRIGATVPGNEVECARRIAVELRLYMHFGPTPIRWMSMTAAEARAFAAALLEKARQLDGLSP